MGHRDPCELEGNWADENRWRDRMGGGGVNICRAWRRMGDKQKENQQSVKSESQRSSILRRKE